MTWLLFLHLEIDRRIMYPCQWRYWQNVQQYMQDANLNSGTPIFKNSHFGTICESWLFETTPFHMQSVFISKAKHILNTKVLKRTLHLHVSCFYWLKCLELLTSILIGCRLESGNNILAFPDDLFISTTVLKFSKNVNIKISFIKVMKYRKILSVMYIWKSYISQVITDIRFQIWWFLAQLFFRKQWNNDCWLYVCPSCLSPAWCTVQSLHIVAPNFFYHKNCPFITWSTYNMVHSYGPQTLYNYFIPFCATVKTITHKVLRKATVHQVIHSTEGVIVLTVAQKGMK